MMPPGDTRRTPTRRYSLTARLTRERRRDLAAPPARAGARSFAKCLEGFGGAHAGGLQQIDGRRPDLTDEHAGLEVAALLEHGRCLPCGTEREVAGIERVIRPLQIAGEGLYREGELQNRLRQLPWRGPFLAHHRDDGAGEHAGVTHGEV